MIQDSHYIKKCNFKKFCSRACRKAVASAFSTANMKAQFPNIRTSCAQLVTVLKTLPRGEVVDMDSALCRESLDVIGDAPCPITFFTLGFIKGVGFCSGFWVSLVLKPLIHKTNTASSLGAAVSFSPHRVNQLECVPQVPGCDG